jgi:hypothetical protein
MSEAVNLRELMEAAQEPPKQPARVFGPGWWLRRVIAALAVAGGLWCVLYALRIGMPFPLIAFFVLAIMVLRAALGLIADDPMPPEITGEGYATTIEDREAAGMVEGLRRAAGTTDGVRYAVGRWDDRLSWGERDASRFAAIVVPRIADLVDERLRQRHSLTRASDPARARALLGEDLWRFLHSPPAKGLAPKDVAPMIAKVEEL